MRVGRDVSLSYGSMAGARRRKGTISIHDQKRVTIFSGRPLDCRAARGATLIWLLLLGSCTGEGDRGRPGFPRTPRTPLAGAPLPYVSPEEVGLSEDGIWRFKERLYARVVARHVVGAEILVVKDRRVVLHQAMGWSDRERRTPLERNSIYRIASMTKPFAGTAALMLWEDGLLGLDDRVADYLPSFRNERMCRRL